MTAISTARILVSNDDGIGAKGLGVLESIARDLSDDVWVIAPDSEQSGAGHSLTLTEPVRLRKLDEKRYAVKGTPTDCVVMAVNHVMKDNLPTLLLSGINAGGNLAEDVTYSGTVAAAMEGTLARIPSIALSQVFRGRRAHDMFAAAKAHAKPVIERIVNLGFDEHVLVNVNFPARDADNVEGIRVTEQGFRDLSSMNIEERKDMRGVSYFWYGMGRSLGEPGHETALKAIHEGCISITPLHLDLTHFETRDRFRGAFEAP